MYEYNATVTKLVDGDTIYFKVDLGFTVSVNVHIRLYGVDTPEIHGVKKESEEFARGMVAKEFVAEWLSKPSGKVVGAAVRLKSYDGKNLITKTGKYGRWLAKIYRPNDEVSLNDALVAAGQSDVVFY